MLVLAHSAGHGVLVVLVALGGPMGAGAVARRLVTSAGSMPITDASLAAHAHLAIYKCQEG